MVAEVFGSGVKDVQIVVLEETMIELMLCHETLRQWGRCSHLLKEELGVNVVTSNFHLEQKKDPELKNLCLSWAWWAAHWQQGSSESYSTSPAFCSNRWFALFCGSQSWESKACDCSSTPERNYPQGESWRSVCWTLPWLCGGLGNKKKAGASALSDRSTAPLDSGTPNIGTTSSETSQAIQMAFWSGAGKTNGHFIKKSWKTMT